jgi:hypothetical protein
MADDCSVTDDEILTGFKSVQEAMALGFERQSAEFRSVVHTVVRSEVAVVRAEISALEHRMLRRFDEVDARFDGVDARFDRVEARLERIEAHVGIGEA